jgi:hypothetical protein
LTSARAVFTGRASPLPEAVFGKLAFGEHEQIKTAMALENRMGNRLAFRRLGLERLKFVIQNDSNGRELYGKASKNVF